jgi:hypothetical protein
MMLDLLSGRLQSRAAVEPAHQTLCTVVRNAAANADAGGADDPKYRTLRAQNDKLWSRLLCHREMVSVLGAAGFEMQRLPHATGHGDGAAASTSAAFVGCTTSCSVGGRLPSFIESDFATKVEYDAWVAAAVAARASSDDVNTASAVVAPGMVALHSELPTQRELDREAELHAVHVALAEQLDGAVPPTPDVIEALLCRLQELSVAGDVSASDGSGGHERRDFELVHPGSASAEAMEGLEAVLAGVAAWCFDSAHDGQGL